MKLLSALKVESRIAMRTIFAAPAPKTIALASAATLSDEAALVVEVHAGSSQTIMPIGEPRAALKLLKPNFAAYALGFRISDYHGHKLVDHTGGLAGLVSKVEMMPDENLGIVVLTNQEEAGAYQSIIYHVLDPYLKLPPTDWTTAFRNEKGRQLVEAAEVEKRQSSARDLNAKPSLPLERYARKYNDAWYGSATIKL